MPSKRKSKGERKEVPKSPTVEKQDNSLAQLHVRFGWWLLLVFVILGVILESLHGFKVAWYLNVGQESRRLLWRLSHAHGTFLALVNIGFAATLWIRGLKQTGQVMVASRCLFAGSVLIPAGFFWGGTTLYANDPGVGIILLPIGAALLIIAAALMAIAKK